MRYVQLLTAMMIIACVFSACVKEGINCPNCPRGNTGARGNVIFFTKSSCSDGSAYTVVVDDTIQVAVAFSASVPDCNNGGFQPLSLKSGSHKWKASCSTQENIVSGVINITANGCLVKEIK